MKNTIILLFLVVTTIACKEAKNDGNTKISVESEYKEGIGLAVLQRFTSEGVENIDSTEINSNGSFEFSVHVAQEDFFRINIFDTRYINLILDPSETKVDIVASGQTATSPYVVKGSKQTSKLLFIDSLGKKRQQEVQLINQELMMAQQNQDQEAVSLLMDEYYRIIERYTENFKNSIREFSPSLVSLYATNYIDLEENIFFIDTIYQETVKKLPEHVLVQQIGNQIPGIKKLAPGAMAPQIALPNPEGKIISLTDLKGKYVLIDFWAAWCKPCRQENPNVVLLYNQYKNHPFEILGVSLDKTAQAWTTAIAEDRLTWLHVSDLAYFNSAAAREYSIQAIPATYLIGPDGTILAKNLRGESLRAKLAELFDEKS